MKAITALSFGLVAAMAATGAQAGSYQTEVGGAYLKQNGDFVDATGMVVGGTYALKPIDTSKGPLAEAAFLNPTSTASAAIVKISIDAFGGTADGTVSELGFDYVDNNLPVLLGATFSKGSGDIGDSTGYGLKAGYYATPTLLVGASYGSDKTDDTGTVDTETTLAVTAKWLNTGAMTYAVEGGYTSEKSSGDSGDSSDSSIGLGATYYLDGTLGLGASFSKASGDTKTDEGSTVGVHVSKYFAGNVGVFLGYDKFSVSDTAQGEDNTTITLEVAARF